MIRIGQGYDVHQLVKGRDLILGGVKLDYHLGLDGHSDADVIAHAAADAVLGAMGMNDIGVYFPPTDPQYKNLDSMLILHKCRELLEEHGYTLNNIDITLIAQAPKISPYTAQMKANIGKALGIKIEQIGLKATTNETMGFVGREEGMTAMAVALIETL